MSKDSVLAKFSDLMRGFRICKFKNRAFKAKKVRALFLTFPHKRATFQWSKVVSEAVSDTGSARNKNLRPLLNRKIPLISGKIWPQKPVLSTGKCFSHEEK